MSGIGGGGSGGSRGQTPTTTGNTVSPFKGYGSGRKNGSMSMVWVLGFTAVVGE